MSKKSESTNKSSTNKTETKTEKEVIEKEIDESTSPETKIEVEVEVEEHSDPAFEVGYNGEPLSKAFGRLKNNRLEKETRSRSWSRGMIERKLDYLSEWADRQDIDSVALMGLMNKLKALCREYGDES